MEDYFEPYSDQWKKELMKFKKEKLIEMYKAVCIENISLKNAYQTHIEGVNKLPLAAVHNLARTLPFPTFEAELKIKAFDIPVSIVQKCPICSGTDLFSFVSIHSKCKTCNQQWTD